jgi:hypothetical protein
MFRIGTSGYADIFNLDLPIEPFVFDVEESDDESDYETEIETEYGSGCSTEVVAELPNPRPPVGPKYPSTEEEQHSSTPLGQLLNAYRPSFKKGNDKQQARYLRAITDYLYHTAVTPADVELLVPEFNRHPFTLMNRMTTNIGLFYSRGAISETQLEEMYTHMIRQGDHRVNMVYEKVKKSVESFKSRGVRGGAQGFRGARYQSNTASKTPVNAQRIRPELPTFAEPEIKTEKGRDCSAAVSGQHPIVNIARGLSELVPAVPHVDNQGPASGFKERDTENCSNTTMYSSEYLLREKKPSQKQACCPPSAQVSTPSPRSLESLYRVVQSATARRSSRERNHHSPQRACLDT